MAWARWMPAVAVGWVAAMAFAAAPASAAPVGSFTTFPTPNPPFSVLLGITAGPDGNVWFASGSDAIGRITPSGTLTAFTAGITAGSRPNDITVGPDGNLWFTEEFGHRVARMTPTGAVTEFAAGITVADPFGITAGPDGNLWFTEAGIPGAIGRITPTGTVTEFSTGGGVLPLMIVAGPDGNLWFTDGFGDNIGRITPSGVITLFPVTSGTTPFGITVGPDGNLWYAEQNGPFGIGRITTAGVHTDFAVPFTGDTPTDVAVGADGNLWFTYLNGSRVGRITTSGTVTTFSTVPTSQGQYNLTPGPDGGMWFTDAHAGLVGRVNVLADPLGPAACTTAVVSGVTPATGAPGTTVTIAGAGFGCATGVLFGDTPALGFTVDGDGRITARAPFHSPGEVDVRVMSGAGPSPAVPADRFAFTADPLIAPAPARRLTCARVPTLTGYRLAQARRVLARDRCDVTLTVAGRPPRRGHRKVTAQTPKPGTPVWAGDPAPTVRFD